MWYNPIVTWLLRSPLHGVMSRSTLLLTYTGRKSGKTFTFPISYGQEGQTLWLITRNDKTWVKNIPPEGLRVNAYIHGHERRGIARTALLPPEMQLEKMLLVYKGMPRSLAEKQLPQVLAITLTLE